MSRITVDTINKVYSNASETLEGRVTVSYGALVETRVPNAPYGWKHQGRYITADVACKMLERMLNE